MEKLANAIAEAFMAKYPNVQVTHEFTGSSAGLESLAAGSVDIGDASRALTDDEKELLELYRSADADTQKAATSALKGEAPKSQDPMSAMMGMFGGMMGGAAGGEGAAAGAEGGAAGAEGGTAGADPMSAMMGMFGGMMGGAAGGEGGDAGSNPMAAMMGMFGGMMGGAAGGEGAAAGAEAVGGEEQKEAPAEEKKEE